ncbi:hypothetical protein HF313_12805 [Massilia atriviolacea]|uniref:SH3 domain-containing protein n=1 Tax=Massilia atriviolacea TaxID=2495579 RepID=A0A430HQ34_9BURK|nr:hypothetical protein [Massilia atriviolacea]RSZ59626.1 hypothetical protein EJB06_05355 [Massilia atriviolacea]
MVKPLFASIALIAQLLGMSPACHAGSNTGFDYTNFGHDLTTPVFPKDRSLAIYKDRNDAKPSVVLNDVPVLQLRGDWKPCIAKNPLDGWVRCTIGVDQGWVKRAAFDGPQDALPVEKWAFRYWLFVASDGSGGEETLMLYEVVPRSPYLIKPKQFDNVFFLVHFDEQGFAISPKTKKRTGDRVFLVGNKVFLAPAEPQKRLRTPWLFLTFYNAELKALCPGASKANCLSAVNPHPQWPGIKALNESPPKSPGAGDTSPNGQSAPWFGQEKVAFARHDDPVLPFLYHVPPEVTMMADGSSPTEAQLKKNRLTPFCLIDCKPGANVVIPDPKPGMGLDQ